MKPFEQMKTLAALMKAHAESGVWGGLQVETVLPYFRNAKQIHQPSGTMLIFTRESGYHSGGWFKNPDYEQCYHLSVSFWDLEQGKPIPFEPKLAKVWCSLFFGEATRYIWEESGTIKDNVRHYRVFCDVAWQPILPRGEVYSKDFTEKGWKSWSELVVKE